MIADPLWSCVMLLCGPLWVLCGPLRYLVIPVICTNFLAQFSLHECNRLVCKHCSRHAHLLIRAVQRHR